MKPSAVWREYWEQRTSNRRQRVELVALRAMEEVRLADKIHDLCSDLLRGLNAILGKNLYGVYLYGAIVFPDAGTPGDIDFHVILRKAPGTDAKSALRDLHASLARDHPPLGAELDGYYILLEDARRETPPRHQLVAEVYDHSWALHRAHIRAGRCIVLQGPDPSELFPAASWPELDRALQGELDYVADHLDDYPAYCVLNLCRLMYSFETHDVVISKRASAEWADATFPEWRPLVEAARNSYDRQATPGDKKLLELGVTAFFSFARERIRESKKEAQR